MLGFVGAMQMQPRGGGGPSLTQEASRVRSCGCPAETPGISWIVGSAFSFCLLLNFPPLSLLFWWVQTNPRLSITDRGPTYRMVSVFCVYISMLYILFGGSEMKNLPAI